MGGVAAFRAGGIGDGGFVIMSQGGNDLLRIRAAADAAAPAAAFRDAAGLGEHRPGVVMAQGVKVDGHLVGVTLTVEICGGGVGNGAGGGAAFACAYMGDGAVHLPDMARVPGADPGGRTAFVILGPTEGGFAVIMAQGGGGIQGRAAAAADADEGSAAGLGTGGLGGLGAVDAVRCRRAA